MADKAFDEWTVLINDEQQYALHPAGHGPPPGWRPAGFTGSEADCVRHVDEHWTDMRPLSLRKAMDG
ncbi:MbtH family NRPS accessory protein [Kibdelosporangium persicum]|uniref:MbtH family protein n=1 Tax=Kibdelosporangium persicum TaxID=2698649 RepID=UPI00156463A5|nr:MbtH family NRPS accessory protein [Kibdelosporangium persicum]